MRTATRKNLQVVGGLCRFAQVTVARADFDQIDVSSFETLVILNEHVLAKLSDDHQALLAAARRGVRDAETALRWHGPQHFVLKIEGVEVDGVDTEAVYVAAGEATRVLIEK